MPKRNPLKTLQNKADRLLQEYHRNQDLKCEGCGRPAVCMHHYFTKSNSAVLRYYEPNLIPVCEKCHPEHHWGNPKLHSVVMMKRGEEWFKDLEREMREKGKTFRTNQGYYKSIIKKYEKKS